MQVITIPTIDILDFEKQYGLNLVVTERPASYNLPKYYATFPNVDIIENSACRSTFGDGETPDEAVTNFAAEISEQRLVKDAYSQQRQILPMYKFTYIPK